MKGTFLKMNVAFHVRGHTKERSIRKLRPENYNFLPSFLKMIDKYSLGTIRLRFLPKNWKEAHFKGYFFTKVPIIQHATASKAMEIQNISKTRLIGILTCIDRHFSIF